MKVPVAAGVLAALAPLLDVRAAVDTATREKIEVAGTERSYFLFVPESVPAARPAPVLTEWRELAGQEGFVLVAPNASDDRYWQIRRGGYLMCRSTSHAA